MPESTVVSTPTIFYHKNISGQREKKTNESARQQYKLYRIFTSEWTTDATDIVVVVVAVIVVATTNLMLNFADSETNRAMYNYYDICVVYNVNSSYINRMVYRWPDCLDAAANLSRDFIQRSRWNLFTWTRPLFSSPLIEMMCAFLLFSVRALFYIRIIIMNRMKYEQIWFEHWTSSMIFDT